MADNQLPHNDPDMELARMIGKAREEDSSIPDGDSLFPPLLEYRQQVHRQQKSSREDKQQVWRQISKETVPAGKKATIYRLFTAKNYRYAAAAIVLIAALASIIYVQFWPQAELLLKSGDSIETIQLADGSTVKLRPHSRLYKVKQTASVLLYKLKGEAFLR